MNLFFETLGNHHHSNFISQTKTKLRSKSSLKLFLLFHLIISLSVCKTLHPPQEPPPSHQAEPGDKSITVSFPKTQTGGNIETQMIKVFPREITQVESDRKSRKTTNTNTNRENSSIKRIQRKTNNTRSNTNNRKPFQPSPLVPIALPLPPNFGSYNSNANGETKFGLFKYTGETQYNSEALVGVTSSTKLYKGNEKIYHEDWHKSKTNEKKKFGETPNRVGRHGSDDDNNKLLKFHVDLPISKITKSTTDYAGIDNNINKEEYLNGYYEQKHQHQVINNLEDNAWKMNDNNIETVMGAKSHKKVKILKTHDNNYNGLVSPEVDLASELSPPTKQEEHFHPFYDAPTQHYDDHNDNRHHHQHEHQFQFQEVSNDNPYYHLGQPHEPLTQYTQPLHHEYEPLKHSADEPIVYHGKEKLITKTIIGSTALKKGSISLIFSLVIVVLAFAALGLAGLTFSPVALPFAVLPIAIIAFLLFIPLFILFVPIVISGLGGRKKRKRRSASDPLAFNDFNFLMGRDSFHLLFEKGDDGLVSTLFTDWC